MTEAIVEDEIKHNEKRKKIEEKIRSTPIRRVPNCDIPASAQVVLENKEWYKSFAKLSLFALLFVSACAVSVSIALAYVMSRPPETLSYLMDEDGRIVQLESIRNPSLTETEVLNWAAGKIKAIHSLTFTDYVDHVQSLSADFTDTAFIEYQKALLSSKSLEKVKQDRLVMWADPKEAPKIISAKVVNGKFTWVVEMKITQYLAGGEYIANGTDMLATVVIERTSRARNLSGVVISQYLAKEIGS
tara:strand:+ start:4729 stop:5463 length:735 start_codon:yes stop_codon:yes gene_type:complete